MSNCICQEIKDYIKVLSTEMLGMLNEGKCVTMCFNISFKQMQKKSFDTEIVNVFMYLEKENSKKYISYCLN